MNDRADWIRPIVRPTNIARAILLATTLSLSGSTRVGETLPRDVPAASESFGERMLQRPEIKQKVREDVMKRLREDGDARPDDELEKEFEKYWNDPEFRKQVAKQIEEALGMGDAREREMLAHCLRLYVVFKDWAKQLQAGSQDLRTEEGKAIDPKELRESPEEAMKYLDKTIRVLESDYRGKMKPLLRQYSQSGAPKMDTKTFLTIQSFSQTLREVEGVLNVYGNSPVARQLFMQLWEWLKDELESFEKIQK